MWDLVFWFFAPHVSNKVNNRRSLENGFDVIQSFLCSSSNLSIYKLLPKLSSKPLMYTAFRHHLYSDCSAFQRGTRGLFNQQRVWAASLALMWHLCYCKPAVWNLVQADFILAIQRAWRQISGLHKISTVRCMGYSTSKVRARSIPLILCSTVLPKGLL